MVSFYKETRKQENKKAFEVEVHDLDMHGRAVAKANNKTWFIKNLLIGEKARVIPISLKNSTGEAQVTKILQVSDKRQKEDCPYLKECGGCTLQYMPNSMAIDAKVNGIKRLLNKTLNIELGSPNFIEQGKDIGYRRACRFAIKTDHNKVKLGFRGAYSHNLVSIDNCVVLNERINKYLNSVYTLINTLKARKNIGHIEFLDSDGWLGILFRFTKIIDIEDKEALIEFAKSNRVCISIVEPYKHEVDDSEYLKETVLYGENELFIFAENCKIHCKPSAFVQINKELNAKMINKVLEFSCLKENTKVLDLFCGLGNFSLPLASHGAQVVGVDIVRTMIEDANKNAQDNNLNNTKFVVANLEDVFENQLWAKDKYDVVVMDPGRSGAKRATSFVCKMKVKKIIMISCNPLAASRDCVDIIKSGYKLESWGVFDIFPRTTHVELMLVFSL